MVKSTRPKFSLPRNVWSWESQFRQEALVRRSAKHRLRAAQQTWKRNLKRILKKILKSDLILRHLTRDLRHLKILILISELASLAKDNEHLPLGRLLSWTMMKPKCGQVCRAQLPRANTLQGSSSVSS